jgi:WD40 repeat protein
MREWALAFHPNGQRLAIGHADKSVSVYDLATGRRVHSLTVAAAPFHLAFPRRQSRLAVATGSGVQLFDTKPGEELPAPRRATGTWVEFVAWHPDGRRLAAGCHDRKIRVWDTQTGAEVMRPWTGHTTEGIIPAFNHPGDRLGSTAWNGQTSLWDAVNGRRLPTTPSDIGREFGADDGCSASRTAAQSSSSGCWPTAGSCACSAAATPVPWRTSSTPFCTATAACSPPAATTG